MLPTNKTAEQAIVSICESLEQSNLIEIEWSPGRMLLIDNWRMLHGRASAREDDRDRELLRVLVEVNKK